MKKVILILQYITPQTPTTDHDSLLYVVTDSQRIESDGFEKKACEPVFRSSDPDDREVGQSLPSSLFPQSLNHNSKNTKVKSPPTKFSRSLPKQYNDMVESFNRTLQMNRWFPIVSSASFSTPHFLNPLSYGFSPPPMQPIASFTNFMPPQFPQPIDPFAITNIHFPFQMYGPKTFSTMKDFHSKVSQLKPFLSSYNLLYPGFRTPSLPSDLPFLLQNRLLPSVHPEHAHLLRKPEEVSPQVSSGLLMTLLQRALADSVSVKAYPTSEAHKNKQTELYHKALQNLISELLSLTTQKTRNPKFANHLIKPHPFLPPPGILSPIPGIPTTPAMLDHNTLPWLNFAGVKRFSFAPFCQGRTTFSFGSCSPIYLSCNSQAQQYSFEECPSGQDTRFCMQGEGIYVTSLNKCSRQAIVCTDYYHGFGISCAHDQILSPTSLECIPSPAACSSWTLPPVQFAPWKFELINYYCQLISDENYFFSTDRHYEHYCRNWYVDCRRTVRDIVMCEKGQIYDPQNRRCRLSTPQDPCFLPSISCEGSNWYNIGLGQCLDSFVRCESGLIRKYMCSDGMVFHEGKCVHPLLTSGTCSVCNEGKTKQLPNEKCNQYSVCEFGQWVQRLCPYGQAYSQAEAACVQNFSCTRFIGNCSGGKRIPISRNEYMECSWDGHYQKKACPLLHSWNLEQQRCTFDGSGSVGTSSSCTEGQVIESWDCQNYFQCIAGQWKKFSCSNGIKMEGCQRCLSGAYQPQFGAHLECISGRTQHDVSNCAFYRRCVDGRWRKEQCLNGFLWNQKLGRCDLYSDCPQYRRVNCMEMERIAYFDGVNCDGYFECSRGLWSLYKCPMGHIFDSRVNRCMSSFSGCSAIGNLPALPMIRPPLQVNRKFGAVSYYPELRQTSKLASCKIGSLLPDDYDCSRFYICTEAGYMPSACRENMGFNPVTRLCEQTFRCDSKKCIDGHTKPGPQCGQYFECINGEWSPKKCPGTQYFAAGKCHFSFGRCGMLPHSQCFNGQAVAIDADCSSYLVCQDGLFQRRHCEYGTFFNPTSRYCSPSYKCPFCANGQVKPYKNHCSDYMSCIGGHFERKSCPADQHFEVSKLQCMPGKCGINMTEMETCMESPGPLGYRAHPILKGSFMQCAHGKWVVK
uniref:Chitin-binding type-2 domain-containing protein n=1 Tax=Syphacia muris TaxID=451379 RepID=A0A0N5ABT1_9BILA